VFTVKGEQPVLGVAVKEQVGGSMTQMVFVKFSEFAHAFFSINCIE
jgi:hypothetical protein